MKGRGPAHTGSKFHEAGGATIEMPLEVFDGLTNEMARSANKIEEENNSRVKL